MDLGHENYKGFIAAPIFAFAKQLSDFLLFVFFHVKPTFSLLKWCVHITLKKPQKVYLVECQFCDDGWWLPGMPVKSPLQCHYNRRWGWGKQFQCGSMETPLPDHNNCRLFEEQEPAEPCLCWHSCNMILICQNNSNARHQNFFFAIINNREQYFIFPSSPSPTEKEWDSLLCAKRLDIV